MTNEQRRIAYFSMEIGVRDEMPTYAGGLGMLAGDTIRSAADMRVPMVAVTLLHRRGYFYQRIDSSGWQIEEPVQWVVEDFLTDTGVRTEVEIEERKVQIRAWHYEVNGSDGESVPVYFLDTQVAENSEWDRTLTDNLYGGDAHYRLCQEVILGIGGVRILRVLGYHGLERFHMNEGHAALLTLELLREERERAGRSDVSRTDIEAVHAKCVFTTHTPVQVGHDQFPLEMVDRVLGDRQACGINDPICHEGRLNMTFLALSFSRYVNGVAKRHGEVASLMFAGYKIDAITNGVHAGTWVAPPLAKLFDRYIVGWQQDNFSLRHALSIPDEELWTAHQATKQLLIDRVNDETNAGLATQVLTIGCARRATPYKRIDLILDDVERLRRISAQAGRLQLVFAGKAHPNDNDGKRLIQRVIQLGRSLRPELKVVYLPNYDMRLAGLLTAGADLWLNTPEPPLEASGTSGMKAAMNGVPSLSVLDGWWIEGGIENLTGWATDASGRANERAQTSKSLYDKLEGIIVPMYYHYRDQYTEIMRHTITLNGSFFNTQRMLQQYIVKAYY